MDSGKQKHSRFTKPNQKDRRMWRKHKTTFDKVMHEETCKAMERIDINEKRIKLEKQ